MVKVVGHGDEATRLTWHARNRNTTSSDIESGAQRTRRAVYDARFAQARRAAVAGSKVSLVQPPPVPARVEQPLSEAPRRRSGNWSQWIAVAVGSAALVAAGYLGALVQLGISEAQVPRPIQQSAAPLQQAKPDSSATPTLVQVPPVRVAIGEAARVGALARRPKGQRVDAKAAALATAELERELDTRQAPMLGIRSLPKRDAAAAVPSRAQPTRPEVQQALLAMRPQLEACAAGRHGMVEARVGIAGTGHVTHALIQGAFAGTAEGSCMARALRAATVPPFSVAIFQVQYPFAL
jgi:hypothetical protein